MERDGSRSTRCKLRSVVGALSFSPLRVNSHDCTLRVNSAHTRREMKMKFQFVRFRLAAKLVLSNKATLANVVRTLHSCCLCFYGMAL